MPRYASFAEIDSGPAERLGFVSRPVSETIADLLAWTTQRKAGDRAAGLATGREAELLELWSGLRL